MSEVSIHTDGACRGNPGEASIAYLIEGLSSDKIEFFQPIGITTNNQAEYQAMVAALTKVVELEVSDSRISVHSDSELMVKQIRGEYRVKDVNLQPHHQKIKQLERQITESGNSITFTAVRREQNAEADRLANLALDTK